MKKSLTKHVLFKNFLALSTLQGVNLILPFITLPYLARVLGVTGYGVVVMVYSVMQLLTIINDYGFNLSATKEVSLHRGNFSKINTIFNSIIIVKAILIILSLIILLILIYSISVIYENKEAYILGFGIVIGQSVTPIWLFQGMEKMKYVTIVNLISKTLFTLLIFFIIKEEKDYVFVPLLYSLGFLLAGLISLVIARIEFGVSIFIPKWVDVKKQIVNSTQYFFSRASVAAYSTGNNFIVGLVLGEFYAGIFAVAEKLYVAMTIIYTPLSDAIYPHMVQNKNLKLFKKIFFCAIIFNLCVSLGIFIFSSEVVHFVFGEGYHESAILLRYFCFLSLVLVPATFMGYPLLGAFGYEKYANYSVVIAGVFHLIILFSFYNFLTAHLIVIFLILTQIMVLAIRGYGVRLLLGKIKY